MKKEKIKRYISGIFLGMFFLMMIVSNVYAGDIPQAESKDYKVAFFPYDCFNMEDEDGRKYGYGYEMMQSIARYMQCTFSYEGYDKSAKECEEMVKNGELDLYTAARITPERQEDFVFSSHPSITAVTCMNVKVGNSKVVAGDYSTYDGLKVGLLKRHTYNDAFIEFTKEKGFSCEIIYYDTPEELSSALINEDVDALVNSYINTPEDEKTVEKFQETPYYIMARKEDQELIDQIDTAFDRMNVETPNWRTELYNRYYGSPSENRSYTAEEKEFLEKLKKQDAVIKGIMNPDARPYSWFEDGEAKGITADLFKATAGELGLDWEILSVTDKKEYKKLLSEGKADIWMDMNCNGEDGYRYKETDPYMTTTISYLHRAGQSGYKGRIAVLDDTASTRRMIKDSWPDAEVITADSLDDDIKKILNEQADGALMFTFTAQYLAGRDIRNRLQVEIVPGVNTDLYMGVNAEDDYRFYGLWKKTLAEVSDRMSAELVQEYAEETGSATAVTYLYNHPLYIVLLAVMLFLTLLFILLYIQSSRSKKRLQKLSDELAVALEESRDASELKQNFFSKMSHDIRTPLNVVLGMTQVAQKYKNDTPRLENALDSIMKEGNYLLTLINSILDINQLSRGHVELLNEPFDPETCMRESVEILKPLMSQKEQKFSITCRMEGRIVTGDPRRYSQIIVNIISNAIKYTGKGGRIDVELEYLPDGFCRFSCRDNGIGMEEEFVKKICEDYSRAEDSRISEIEGTGLGMSIVKRFTDLMHGVLKIESSPGKGSLFIVDIPFPEASEEQYEQVTATAGIQEEYDENTFAGKKVLLVEDNALNAEIAVELLKNTGVSVDWAENGRAGVEKYVASEEGYYWVIFMDMQMPVMGGVEAAKTIRGIARSDRDIPIFAMTANTSDRDRRICREAGMNGYISKPVNMKEIWQNLRSAE